MYTVINPDKTVLVDYRDNQFVIEDLSSRETCSLPENNFYGNSFKYERDFFNKFLRCFTGKEFVLLTKSGESQYILTKNANREGIF